MGDFEKQVVMNGKEGEQEEERLLLEGMSVLDFDLLCSTVAMQTQHGKWGKIEPSEEDDEEFDYNNMNGGGFRMWEGEVLDCFDDHRVAIESICCPCYRFGKNMRRAGLGSCCLQGTLYFILALSALLNFIAFVVTKRHCFLYVSVAFVLSLGTYLGFFRVQMRKKFNIRGSESLLDNSMYHIFCPCCTLCQESRTLEMNNVQDGTWHGRGDTICVGTYSEGSKALFELCPPPVVSTKSTDASSMQKITNGGDHC